MELRPAVKRSESLRQHKVTKNSYFECIYLMELGIELYSEKKTDSSNHILSFSGC